MRPVGLVSRAPLASPSIITTLNCTDSTHKRFLSCLQHWAKWTSLWYRKRMSIKWCIKWCFLRYHLTLQQFASWGTSWAEHACKQLDTLSRCYSQASWTHVSNWHAQFHLDLQPFAIHPYVHLYIPPSTCRKEPDWGTPAGVSHGCTSWRNNVKIRCNVNRFPFPW